MVIHLRILSWALIFILRSCFLPGKSIAKECYVENRSMLIMFNWNQYCSKVKWTKKRVASVAVPLRDWNKPHPQFVKVRFPVYSNPWKKTLKENVIASFLARLLDCCNLSVIFSIFCVFCEFDHAVSFYHQKLWKVGFLRTINGINLN